MAGSSAEQGAKAFLLEMPVGSENLSNTCAPHDLHRDAIGQ
jgi:hypothetical protein